MFTQFRLNFMLTTALLCAATGCSNDEEGSGSGVVFSPDEELGTLFGDHTIQGTATLPNASEGQLVQITLQGSGFEGSEVGPAGQTPGGETFSYEIRNVKNGTYKIRIRVDGSGDGLSLADPGDFDGYYDGTVDQPILESADASEVTVTDGDVGGIDFGLGVNP